MLAELLALAVASTPGPALERGISLGLFSADPDYRYFGLVDELRGLGATHVQIAWVAWQDDVRATEIGLRAGLSATEAQIVETIAYARKVGLAVTAFPILRLYAAGPGEWRGKIAPSDEEAWWRSYGALIGRAAELAARGGAGRLAIGSELMSREAQRARWLRLIDQLRLGHPDLELLYSANWDHFQPVSFWDAVDVVGVTAYFELTRDYDAPVAALSAAWRPHLASLADLSRALGRPIVITEIGYPSLDGAAAWPWDETRAVAIDLDEQARAYEAFLRAADGERWLGGIHFWNWFGFGGPRDGGYTPRNKPAEAILRRFFAGARAPRTGSATVRAP